MRAFVSSPSRSGVDGAIVIAGGIDAGRLRDDAMALAADDGIGETLDGFERSPADVGGQLGDFGRAPLELTPVSISGSPIGLLSERMIGRSAVAPFERAIDGGVVSDDELGDGGAADDELGDGRVGCDDELGDGRVGGDDELGDGGGAADDELGDGRGGGDDELGGDGARCLGSTTVSDGTLQSRSGS